MQREMAFPDREGEGEGELTSHFPQKQQQQSTLPDPDYHYDNHVYLHQDLVERQERVVSQLGELAKQEQALRQENVNLKIANLDLNNRLNVLLPTASVMMPKSISVRSTSLKALALALRAGISCTTYQKGGGGGDFNENFDSETVI